MEGVPHCQPVDRTGRRVGGDQRSGDRSPRRPQRPISPSPIPPVASVVDPPANTIAPKAVPPLRIASTLPLDTTEADATAPFEDDLGSFIVNDRVVRVDQGPAFQGDSAHHRCGRRHECGDCRAAAEDEIGQRKHAAACDRDPVLDPTQRQCQVGGRWSPPRDPQGDADPPEDTTLAWPATFPCAGKEAA